MPSMGYWGGVEVHICEGLHDDAVAEIADLRALQMGGQIGIKAGNDAVLQHQAAVLENVQAAHGGRMDDIAA